MSMNSALLFPSISLLMLSWVQRKGDTNLLIWICLPIKTRAIIQKVHTYFIVHGHLEYYSGFGAAGMSKGPILTVARTSPGLLFSCNLSSCNNIKLHNYTHQLLDQLRCFSGSPGLVACRCQKFLTLLIT